MSDDEIDETEITVNSMVLYPYEYELRTKFSIRDESKFTEHFMKIFDKVRSKLIENKDKDSGLSINPIKLTRLSKKFYSKDFYHIVLYGRLWCYVIHIMAIMDMFKDIWSRRPI